jgi:hypothetical protein
MSGDFTPAPGLLRMWFTALDGIEPTGGPFLDPINVQRQLAFEQADLCGRRYRYPGQTILPERDVQSTRGYKLVTESRTQSEEDWYQCLFYVCHQKMGTGVINIGNHEILLLSSDCPTFDDGAADLVGINSDGGLVVFECKLGPNRQQPLSALLQSIHYMASFIAATNHEKLVEDASRRIATFMDKGRNIPKSFRDLSLRNDKKSQAILLAPRAYYQRYSEHSSWKQFLRDLSAKSDFCSFTCTVAITDYSTNQTELVSF